VVLRGRDFAINTVKPRFIFTP